MDLGRYRELYLSETREHLAVLSRGLQALEAEGWGGEALDQAFRAAHTIKGMSATIGYDDVARLAHELEDRLEEVRSGRRRVDRALVDELLAAADVLEAAVERAVAGGEAAGAPTARRGRTGRGERGRTAAPGEARAGEGADLPGGQDGDGSAGGEQGGGAVDGRALVMRVVIRPDAPMAAARALLVMRNAAAVAPVLRSEPAEPGLDWAGGVLRLWFPADADRAALERAARAAGDVVDVRFEGGLPAGEAATAVGAAARESGAAPGVGQPLDMAGRHVRVALGVLDELSDGVGELAVLAGRLREMAAEGGKALTELADRFERLIGDLQHTVLRMRMVPVGDVFDRFPRLVREAARELGRQVDFEIRGREIEIDRAILDQLAEPLLHLLRNAVDHGLEPPEERRARGKPERGRLLLQAARERSSVVIRVEDDGRGVSRARIAERARAAGLIPDGAPAELSDEELLRLMSRPGFSTAEKVTEISGRGVGLDVVVNTVRRLGGALEMRTEEGRGTRFTLRLPLTLAVIQALRVQIGGETYAIPLTHIAEAVELGDEMVGRVRGREVLRLRGEVMPLVRLREVLRAPMVGGDAAAVIAQVGERRAALAVDRLVSRDRILVKRFDAPVGALPLFSGVTLLADGRPALVLDPTSVL
ncbi:MAG TPA: chemotaxis protein CheA [Longimicrobiales bacterium]